MRGSRRCGPRLDNGFEDAFLGDLAALVDQAVMPENTTVATSTGGFIFDFGLYMNGVAKNQWAEEHPLLEGKKGDGLHKWALASQTCDPRKSQQAVGDPPPEMRPRRKLLVDVQGIIVASDSGKVDDVGFSDGARRAYPLLTDLNILKVKRIGHRVA